MLLTNGYNVHALRFLGGQPATAANAFSRGGWAIWNRVAFSEFTSYPPGRRATAIKLAVSDGGLGGACTGLADSTTAIKGWGSVVAEADGIATTAGAITGLKDAVITIAAGATTSMAIKGRGDISATLNIGELTQDDVTSGVLEAVIENGLSLKEVLRVLLAVAAGKTDIAGSVVTFRDTADAKDRVVANMTGSERTTVTIDAT
jgi:hypothetical protein